MTHPAPRDRNQSHVILELTPVCTRHPKKQKDACAVEGARLVNSFIIKNTQAMYCYTLITREFVV